METKFNFRPSPDPLVDRLLIGFLDALLARILKEMNDPCHSLLDPKYYLLRALLTCFEFERLPMSCFKNGHMRGIVFLQLVCYDVGSLRDAKYSTSTATQAEMFALPGFSEITSNGKLNLFTFLNLKDFVNMDAVLNYIMMQPTPNYVAAENAYLFFKILKKKKRWHPKK